MRQRWPSWHVDKAAEVRTGNQRVGPTTNQLALDIIDQRAFASYSERVIA